MHDDLSALKSAEWPMQIFLWFSFPHHHFILGLVSTFKHDDVSMPKTFMCAHSCMMTFLHLKVHNG